MKVKPKGEQMKYTKVKEMDPKRYVLVGYKKDMWFSVQKSKGDFSNKERVYIRGIFYDRDRCISAVNHSNKLRG